MEMDTVMDIDRLDGIKVVNLGKDLERREYIITRGSVLTMQESRAVTVVRPSPFSTRRPRRYVPTLASGI